MMTLKYRPGNLLQELAYDSYRKRYDLMGLYFIISLDEFDAHVISLYDKDGYYQPMSKIEISHEDLYKNGKLFKWKIL